MSDRDESDMPIWAQREIASLRAKGREFEDKLRAANKWRYFTHGIAAIVGAAIVGAVIGWMLP